MRRRQFWKVPEGSGRFLNSPSTAYSLSAILAALSRGRGGEIKKKIEIKPCQHQGDAKRKRVRKCPRCQGRDPPCSPPRPHTRAEACLLQQWQPVEKTHGGSGIKCEEEGAAERYCYGITTTPSPHPFAPLLSGGRGVRNEEQRVEERCLNVLIASHYPSLI